jgi:predicted nucleic acid-binding protein
VFELSQLIRQGNVVLIGPVRQELLSGVKDSAVFERLRLYLGNFEDEIPATADYEAAAKIANLCRSRGVATSAIDSLICAYARQHDLQVLTKDADFIRYAAICDVKLHSASFAG